MLMYDKIHCAPRGHQYCIQHACVSHLLLCMAHGSSLNEEKPRLSNQETKKERPRFVNREEKLMKRREQNRFKRQMETAC